MTKTHGEGQTVIIPGASLDEASAKLLTSIAGPPASTIGQIGNDLLSGLIGDRLKGWRLRNLAQTLRKTSDHIAVLSLTGSQLRSLSDGELNLLISDSTKIESESVADMWARMLAKAITSDKGIRIERENSEVIASLSDQDVILLDSLFALQRALKTYNERWDGSFPMGSMKNNEIFKDFVEPILAKYKESFHSENEEAYALAKMRTKGLIHPPKSGRENTEFWRLSIIDVEYDDDGKRYESLDPTQVFEALEGLDRKIPQESDRLFAITNYTIGPAVSLHYTFTKYGEALMRSCEVTEPS